MCGFAKSAKRNQAEPVFPVRWVGVVVVVATRLAVLPPLRRCYEIAAWRGRTNTVLVMELCWCVLLLVQETDQT